MANRIDFAIRLKKRHLLHELLNKIKRSRILYMIFPILADISYLYFYHLLASFSHDNSARFNEIIYFNGGLS